MIHLINKNDKDVISTAGFVKNAVFYKDMLAFYDSYYKLMSEKPSSLPSYCYKKGNYYSVYTVFHRKKVHYLFHLM